MLSLETSVPYVILLIHITKVVCYRPVMDYNISRYTETKEDAVRSCNQMQSSLANLIDIANLIFIEDLDNETFWVVGKNVSLDNGIKLVIEIDDSGCSGAKIQNKTIQLMSVPCKSSVRYICINSSVDVAVTTQSVAYIESTAYQVTTLPVQTSQTTTETASEKQTPTTESSFSTANATDSGTASNEFDAASFFIGFCIVLFFLILLAVKHVLLIRKMKSEKHERSIRCNSHDVNEYPETSPAPVSHNYENLEQGVKSNAAYVFENKEMDGGYITPATMPTSSAHGKSIADFDDDGYITPATLPSNSGHAQSAADLTDNGYVEMRPGVLKTRATLSTIEESRPEGDGYKNLNFTLPRRLEKSQTLDESRLDSGHLNYENQMFGTGKPKVALKPIVKKNQVACDEGTVGESSKTPMNVKQALKPMPKTKSNNEKQLNLKETKLTTLSMARRALNPIRKFSKKNK